MPRGGHNRLSVEEHKRRGTHRRDRHAPPAKQPRALKPTQTREIAESWPPRRLTDVPTSEILAGDGQKYIDFISQHCKVTMDSISARAGEPLALRRWQQELVLRLFARRGERLRHRQALIGMGRKNGKSVLIAGIGLADLILGPNGGQIYSCAAEKEQARIVFGTARRMVELDRVLGEKLKLYRDFIENRETGSIYRVLSAEAYSKEGLNPHRVIVDEVHALPNRELWDVMSLAQGSRLDPLMIGITTPGVMTDSPRGDSLWYARYQYGCQGVSGEINAPSFLMAWWEPANPKADHRLEATWREANPGFADLNDPIDFQNSVMRTPEAEFRTKRCSQWTATSTAWLPFGTWDMCLERREIESGAPVILGFDGSYNNDTTALVAAQIGPKPHLQVIGCWEKPPGADDSWRVPIAAVEETIRQACRRYKVREVICDPFRWARSIEILKGEGLPMAEYPQNAERMVPATQRFYEAVINHQLTHADDARLARHVDNVVLKIDQRGSRISKESKNSGRKIDLAVAAVMAYDRACQVPAAFIATWR